MLKKETIIANAVLAQLTPEQIAAIEQLSANDENQVIAAKVGEIHRQYDQTILEATGIPRNGDEKSYMYLKRAGEALKLQAQASDTLKTQVQTLTEEKTRLEGLVAKGGNDDELKRQLQNVTAELTQTKTQFTELQGQLTAKETEYQEKLFGMQVDFELNEATKGLKFKPELPESATKVLLQQALSAIKSNKPDYIDDGQGGKRLVFRNQDGAILNNPANALAPFTASELIQKQLSDLGVLDTGKKPGGSGQQGPNPGGGGGTGTTVDISGAKTRLEANDIITKTLMAQGLTRGSAAFDEASQQAWKDNNVQALPEK